MGIGLYIGKTFVYVRITSANATIDMHICYF